MSTRSIGPVETMLSDALVVAAQHKFGQLRKDQRPLSMFS
jgi:hypothetical protein